MKMATIEESIKFQLARVTAESDSNSFTYPASSRRGCLHDIDSDTHIFAGNAGDNPLVLDFLVQAHQKPLAEDFQSRLDEPQYSSSDRLLLRRHEELLGHVQVSKQIGWFHGQRCPLARFQDFCVLPEFRTGGLDTCLLEAAESAAGDEGAMFGFVRTDHPEWFERHGWSCCRGQGHTRANTRALLAHLTAQQATKSRESGPFRVRTWRHYELDALVQMYQQLSTTIWGARQRSLELWQWLVGRKAHDQILIVVSDPGGDATVAAAVEAGNSTIANSAANILGYAVVRDSCIVEMLTLPGHADVRAALIVRACRDAIDRDHHFVSLHTPAADPMHEVLVTAGGSWICDSAATGGQWMLKLLSPERWIERLYPVLHERARDAGVPRPLEIDLAYGKQCLRFTLTRRSSRLEPSEASTSSVHCDWHALQDLLMSNLTFPEAIAQGRLRTPHLSQLRVLAALFPPKLLCIRHFRSCGCRADWQ